jgi:hypothetical protein
MRKLNLLIATAVMVVFSGCGPLFKGAPSPQIKLADKVQLAEQLAKIERMEASLGKMQDSMINMQNTMQAKLEAALQAQAQMAVELKAQGQAGAGNKMSETKGQAGRDMSQSVNDSGMIVYMWIGGVAVFLFFLFVLWQIIDKMLVKKQLRSVEAERDTVKEEFLHKLDPGDLESFKRLQEKIEAKKKEKKR